MKKFSVMVLLCAVPAFSLFGCADNTTTEDPAFDNGREISVVSREDGSGTRSAFIELFGMEEKNSDGSRKDKMTREAVIAKQTDVMMTNIAGEKYAIGYLSLGSLNDTVQAVQIDDVDASAANIKNGTYAVARPFYIATKGEPTGPAKDFISFILSAEGQKVISDSYIAMDDHAPAYAGNPLSGKITVAGSSSVTPVMEKLKEAYEKINPDTTIEIQQSDSTAGMTAVMEGTCDIGMASRELKDNELTELMPEKIALDGIVVIVNKANPISTLTTDQVKHIFTGEAAKWSDVGEERDLNE